MFNVLFNFSLKSPNETSTQLSSSILENFIVIIFLCFLPLLIKSLMISLKYKAAQKSDDLTFYHCYNLPIKDMRQEVQYRWAL